MNPLARKIVRDCLRIREQERLWIHTWKHAYDLAEEVAQEAQLRGASIILSVTSDTLLTHVLKKGPQEAVVTSPDHLRHGVTKASALVILDGPEDPGILGTADKGKALAITGHLAGILGSAVSNRVRTLRVRTTAFTEKAAKTYGISFDKWIQATKRCLAGNQAVMIDLGNRIVQLLRAQKSVHITTRDETDLQFRIRGAHFIIDDGVIDKEDMQRRSFLAHLPAGTVTVAVDESSVDGTVVLDLPRAFLGDTIQGLRLNFKKGRLTDYRALRGEDTFSRALRAATGAKDRLSSLSFGINPNATETFGQPIDTLIQGSVTLRLGDNTFVGGRSQSTFSYEHTLNNAIVSIGPTAMIMDGKLAL